MADRVTHGPDSVPRRMVDNGDGTWAVQLASTSTAVGPTDRITVAQDGIPRRMADNGDGTYSEVVTLVGGSSGGGGSVDGGSA